MDEKPDLPGFKVFGVLRFSAALLNSPCPLCNGQRNIDEKDYCLHVGHHQIPCCKVCLPIAGRILQLADEGIIDSGKEKTRRHEAQDLYGKDARS